MFQATTPPISIGVAVRQAGAAVLGFSLGVALVCIASGRMYPKWVEDNFAFYEAQREQVNWVFIGSSRIGCNIDPQIFDAEMRAHGFDTRSLLFWIGSMSAPETRNIVREMLARQPHPEILVIESVGADGSHRPRTRQQGIFDRTLWWRNLRDLPMLTADIRLGSAPSTLGDHLRLTAVRWFRIGAGPQIAQRYLSEPVSVIKIPVATMGYMPLEREWDGNDLDRRVATLSQNTPSESRRNDHARFHDQILEIVNGRAKVIFLLPIGSPIPSANVAGFPNTLAMNRPNDFPSLYAAEKWSGLAHLLRSGAQEHSRILADELARLMHANLERKPISE